ncbi:hypothetical protein FXO38_31380 [Capsicum annuum]|nr:hypothetical protein FXO38_31380 [Capsicum annuum]
MDNHVKEFGRIFDYRDEMLRSNPGTTCVVKVDDSDDSDGCFLTGVTKGQLLVVVAKDDNNQILPIVWAVVQYDNKNNWTWFVKLLIEDLGLTDGRDYTIILDMQKGLRATLMELLPEDFVGSSILNVGLSDVPSTLRPRGGPRNTPTITIDAPPRPRRRPRKISDNSDAPPRPRGRPRKTTPVALAGQTAPAANVEHVAEATRGRRMGVEHIEHVAATARGREKSVEHAVAAARRRGRSVDHAIAAARGRGRGVEHVEHIVAVARGRGRGVEHAAAAVRGKRKGVEHAAAAAVAGRGR